MERIGQNETFWNRYLIGNRACCLALLLQDHEDTVGSWEKRIEKKKAGKCTVTVDPSKAADSTLISHRQGPREEGRL